MSRRCSWAGVVLRGAACTEILHFPARVLVIEADHLMSASACTVLEELSDVSEVVDDHPHDHHGAPSAAL